MASSILNIFLILIASDIFSKVCAGLIRTYLIYFVQHKLF